jgi:hypothetical protein
MCILRELSISSFKIILTPLDGSKIPHWKVKEQHLHTILDSIMSKQNVEAMGLHSKPPVSYQFFSERCYG